MELLDKGKHCQEDYCHQLDLLPMKCKACNKYFCSEHFKYESHNCKESKKFDFKIPTCELCNNPIEFKRGHDLDLCLAQHMQKCQFNEINHESNKKSANKCSYKSCKSKEIFSFECENCSKKFCTKHRIAEDHNCNKNNSKSCSEQARQKTKIKTYAISSY